MRPTRHVRTSPAASQASSVASTASPRSMSEADVVAVSTLVPASNAALPHSTADGTARHQVVVDHKGAGRVVHRPDGTIVWEPAAEGPVPPLKNPVLRHVVRSALGCMETLASSVLIMGSVVGVAATIQHVDRAYDRGTCFTSRQLTQNVANTVASCIAGTLTGVALGPLHVVRTLGVRLVRPAVIACAVTRGVTWLSRHRSGVVQIIKKLQSGALAQQMEALRAIIARAVQSAAFRREFHRFAGVELLLKHLQEALALAESTGFDSPLLHLLAQAIAQLVGHDTDCKEALVAAGGVPMLVQLLGPARPSGTVAEAPGGTRAGSNPVVVQSALSALAALSDNPIAQDAMRDAGAAVRFVELATNPRSGMNPNVRMQALSLLTCLSLDPAGKQAVGQAGGVASLLALIKSSTSRSPVQAQAVMALHAVVRGSDTNQRALFDMGGNGGEEATATLRAALAAAGPHWCAHKADLHGLLNVLARRKALADAASAAAASVPPAVPPVVVPGPATFSPCSAISTTAGYLSSSAAASPRWQDGGWVDASEANNTEA